MRTENQEQWVSEVRQKLGLGFFVNNLNGIARLLQKVSLTTDRPSARFTLRQAVLYIARSWDERPVTTAEAQSVEARMKPLLLDSLAALEGDLSSEELERSLDRLVLGLLTLDV